MNIQEFISKFHNHPVLFIGSGLSLRYLQNSYNWDGLLKKIAGELKPDPRYYIDIKAEHMNKSGGAKYKFDEVASQLEVDFDKAVKSGKSDKFEDINKHFYQNMEEDKYISRFKLYIADLLKDMALKPETADEIAALKRARKNVGSIITTNYDTLIEQLFAFHPLIGNDIMLSNPYGSVYKIHGCVTQPEQIVITAEDYERFDKKYELIRAQLLSLFIHHPIIFMGYTITDENIRAILQTIFSYVNYESDEAQKIRDNFLLIEYDGGSQNQEVVEHDIDVGNTVIRINKLKTDDFTTIYDCIAGLTLPISAMDIRKVQTVVKEICEGGNIKVSITENLDELDNSDKVLVIGSKKTITYEYMNHSEMMANYFQIIEEENEQLLRLLNKQTIQSSQYFPIFAFSKICKNLERVDELKEQQISKIQHIVREKCYNSQGTHHTPESVLGDDSIARTYKVIEMVRSIMSGRMKLDSMKEYLLSYEDKKSTDYRKLLCAYDLKNNMDIDLSNQIESES